jgi:hypothetical protein
MSTDLEDLRTEEARTEDENTPEEDGLTTASASGVSEKSDADDSQKDMEGDQSEG